MRRKESFNNAAELYNEVRPSYPDELIDWIIEKANISPKDTLLEIAPGTGQCTKKFAERDFRIHAVELGDKLAEILLENMRNKDVTVDVSSFEEWPPLKNVKYNLIYCATAWHWLDSNVKYQKTFDLLNKNGRLAIIWNNSLGNLENKIMEEAYKLLFSYHQDTPFSTKPKTEDEIKVQITETKTVLEDSGHYVLEDYYIKTWSLKQAKEKLIKGFYTQSSYLSLCDEDKTDINEKLNILFESLEDEVETFFKSVVYLCKKNIRQ